jgi:hypothetical protein
MADATIVVLSPSYLPELKKLPDDVVSMDRAVDEVSTKTFSPSRD